MPTSRQPKPAPESPYAQWPVRDGDPRPAGLWSEEGALHKVETGAFTEYLMPDGYFHKRPKPRPRAGGPFPMPLPPEERARRRRAKRQRKFHRREIGYVMKLVFAELGIKRRARVLVVGGRPPPRRLTPEQRALRYARNVRKRMKRRRRESVRGRQPQ
jgi:hypothetical protein